MTKAIFFDIDGTLLSFTSHEMSPATLNALHILRTRGIKLFLATGRHKSMIRPVLDLFPFDGCITLNGQFCFCGDTVLRNIPLDAKDVEYLAEVTRKGVFPCLFLEEEHTYVNMVSPKCDVFPQQLSIPLPPAEDPIRAKEHKLYQVVAFLSKEEEHLLTEHTQHLTPMRWHPDFIDVIASGGGKDHGMDVLLAHFGLSLEETMAFGDGENDLPMLRHAAVGVAMGNANQLVKAEADYVTASVDEDGVVQALRHFGLLQDTPKYC